ncbi:hypothetical protein BLNAU_13842 [Blattamonas nauphoetae]|uniref:Uncharacterized protein n=1 Tax=Blattamonas nauphoetae TaxID=2049346 RepID=A0ABQ9XGV4_9EUKA|nr:hypothetical protein BLNAU_13842 [Blattamonas nauphoetae]
MTSGYQPELIMPENPKVNQQMVNLLTFFATSTLRNNKQRDLVYDTFPTANPPPTPQVKSHLPFFSNMRVCLKINDLSIQTAVIRLISTIAKGECEERLLVLESKIVKDIIDIVKPQFVPTTNTAFHTEVLEMIQILIDFGEESDEELNKLKIDRPNKRLYILEKIQDNVLAPCEAYIRTMKKKTHDPFTVRKKMMRI